MGASPAILRQPSTDDNTPFSRGIFCQPEGTPDELQRPQMATHGQDIFVVWGYRSCIEWLSRIYQSQHTHTQMDRPPFFSSLHPFPSSFPSPHIFVTQPHVVHRYHCGDSVVLAAQGQFLPALPSDTAGAHRSHILVKPS